MRGLEFKIDIQFGWDLFLRQEKKCALSGLPLTFSRHGQTASLDRIDSTIGYLPENVQWTHKAVNQMKMDLPEKDFINLCRTISEYRSC